LQRMGITDIKTSQYSIDKVYDFVEGRRIDRGYSVRNILEIRTTNLEAAGSIIDAAVIAGANIVDLITFDVSNREYYYKQALNMAIMNAIQKANSITMNLGLSSTAVPIKIVENTAMPFQPVQREFAATPIMPGTMNIVANVTVDFVY
ncbi:MAG: SIMPL domain-containing protein, partial [Tissierellia bacterium]|nr:SIMPL domain-containing protein [Tissierellia bacterium]